MRGLLPPIGLLLLLAAAIGVAFWEPWASHEREAEVAWLEAYAAWWERIETGLVEGRNPFGMPCARMYPAELRDPPANLTGAGDAALEGCRRARRELVLPTSPFGALNEWRLARSAVLGEVTQRRAEAAAPTRSDELGIAAAPLAGTDPATFCWPGKAWSVLREDWRLIRRDDFWLGGYADTQRGRIDLAPEVCDPLRRFLGSEYTPNQSVQTVELSFALLILAHEAEHLRSPLASEAEVECVAIQRVRDLVRNAGRSPGYAELMAGLAWEQGYPNLPSDYRTDACRDGSRLDVRPETTVWP